MIKFHKKMTNNQIIFFQKTLIVLNLEYNYLYSKLFFFRKRILKIIK